VTITSFVSIIVIVRFVNHSLTRDNHSIWRSPRQCINAQLLVSIAENSYGPVRRREYRILLRCVARATKSSDHGKCATIAAFCARLRFRV
jgi:hypothetical protein